MSIVCKYLFVCFIVFHTFSYTIKKAPLSRIDDKNFIGPVHKQVGAYLNIPGFLALMQAYTPYLEN